MSGSVLGMSATALHRIKNVGIVTDLMEWLLCAHHKVLVVKTGVWGRYWP